MSNFSSIGFPIETEAEMYEMAERALRSAREIKTAQGRYLIYAEPSGAELWLQLDAKGNFIGMNPHFSGATSRRFALTEAIDNDEHILDGAFHGWANPVDEDGPETGEYPYLFDCPDYRVHPKLALGQTVSVQISAFAHEIRIYEDEEALHTDDERGLKLASEAFIPSGLFVEEGETRRAQGLFTGVILQSATHKTELQKATFYALHVRTLGGEIDVVVDAAHIAEPPVAGQYVYVSAWLSGRIISEPKPEIAPKRSFFSKLKG